MAHKPQAKSLASVVEVASSSMNFTTSELVISFSSDIYNLCKINRIYVAHNNYPGSSHHLGITRTHKLLERPLRDSQPARLLDVIPGSGASGLKTWPISKTPEEINSQSLHAIFGTNEYVDSGIPNQNPSLNLNGWCKN